jgi:hypothetical protein
MAGILTVDTIQSDSSYASTLNVASKMNFAAGMQIGGQDTTFGGMRNRIINGDMRIDQRNAGAQLSNTTSSQYNIDRWNTFNTQTGKFTVQQNAGSVTPPAGFTNYLGITSNAYTMGSDDFFGVGQLIEGYNFADLNWGSANAKTVTVSFWVRSSLTGTFSVGFQNAGVLFTNYTYTINSANTWEYKTITVVPPTTGTWATTNTVALQLYWSLGGGSTYVGGTVGTYASTTPFYIQPAGCTNIIGTNGTTFYITGVQLEKGSAATAFENRQFGQELALCQRYYEKSYEPAVVPGTNTALGITYQHTGRNVENLYGIYHTRFRVDKRGTPTVVLYTLSGTAGQFSNNDSGSNIGNATIYYQSTTGFLPVNNTGGTVSAAAVGWHYTASAEL